MIAGPQGGRGVSVEFQRLCWGLLGMEEDDLLPPSNQKEPERVPCGQGPAWCHERGMPPQDT